MMKKHAFTLIELLVVISIISLLISILLPALGAARKAARTSMCLSRMRQVLVTNYAYQADYKGYNTPLCKDSGHQDYWGADQGKYRWQNYMQVYSGNYNIFNCPEREVHYPQHSVLNQKTEHPDFPGWFLNRGQSLNAGARANMAWSKYVGGYADVDPRRNEDVEDVLVEKGFGRLTNAVAVADGSFWTTTNSDRGATVDYSIFQPSRYVHTGRINLGFLDGHAATRVAEDIDSRPWPNGGYITTQTQ